MQINLTQPPLQKNPELRSWTLVALAAILWVVLYNIIQPMADWLAYGLFALEHGSRLGESLAFFFYDVPKLLLLLSGMIFVISLLQTFIDTQKVRTLVEKRGEGIGNLMAAFFGAVTPFCSCSSVPLFIGFVQAGIPLGITLTFLITSPLISEVAFVMLIGLFGWKIALLYLLSGVTIGMISGLILGRMKLERYVEGFVYDIKPRANVDLMLEEKLTWSDRINRSWDSVKEIVSKVFWFVIFGIAIGAGIHGFVPENALTGIMGKDVWWSVPVSVLIGIPLYSNPAGIIPIVSALLDKGASLGTALAFMMSVIGLSLPEVIILRRVLKPQLITIFIGVVAAAIILTGYLFNLVM
ncbi:MAG: permease [Anaerolineales bacterium]|uniref:permease n=1 Tax=Candidatus Villigracilis vicinus TaxID=3140679 RepID=UPI003136E94D|nr:permease [Anaerolineales bacterium]